MANYIQGFALSGVEISRLKDKSFTIVEVPKYREFTDNATDKKKEKLILRIQLSDNSVVDYYPNSTSQKTIMERAGRNLDNWKGFKGTFVTKRMLIGKDEKEVIFVQ